MSIDKINTQVANMPPAWMSRAQSKREAMMNSEEVKKMLGEAIPRAVDPNTLPPQVAAMFAKNGILERIRKKLANLSKNGKKRKNGGRFIPATGTIASVDEDDNVYVGVDFLEAFGENEDLIAGILAHEWGHMMSDLPKNFDWSDFNWDELHAIRRDEEGDADGFAGRALYLMGYDYEPMIELFEKIEKKKKDKKLQTHKYHNTATRIEIVRQSFHSAKRMFEDAKTIFEHANKQGVGPKIARVIGNG